MNLIKVHMDGVPVVEGYEHIPLCAVKNSLVSWLLHPGHTRGPSLFQHVVTCNTCARYISYCAFNMTQFRVYAGESLIPA